MNNAFWSKARRLHGVRKVMTGESAMNGTTEDHFVIRRSDSKLLGFVLVGALLVAVGVLMIQGDEVDSGDDGDMLIGWLTIVFFGLVSISKTYQLVYGHREPVELSAQGFWDKRVLEQKVPWSAVSRLSVWSYRGKSFWRTYLLRIQLTDEAMQHVRLTKTGRTARSLNKPIGLDGIYISTVDLDMSFPELRLLFQSYLSQYNPSATDDTEL